MIEWYWPWMFGLLPLPLLIRWLVRPVETKDSALVVPDIQQFQVTQDMTAAVSKSGFNLPLLLLGCIWLLSVCAAARPHWIGDAVTLPTSGRDLMLAVDISGCMGTEDMRLQDQMVNRLLVVKQVVNDFVEHRKGDRIGLILFGTNAYLQAPLTFDLTSVTTLLAEAPIGIAGGKTAIGDAIGLAVKRLRRRPEGERVLILLTDGANNVGEVAPLKAAELAATEGVKIYTIGVGADEMQMPGLFGVLGSRIVNPSAELDVETLQAIADQTDGRFYRARNTEKLQEVYAIIDKLEPVDQEAETYRPTASLFHWPLAAGWLLACLLLLGQFLRNRRAQK